MADLRRLGEILQPAAQRLGAGDEALAYTLWQKAAGDQVNAVTKLRRFARGTLTIECESSVWSSELTYLGETILRRMSALDAHNPVGKLRFVTRATPVRQVEEPPAANTQERWRKLAPQEASEATTCTEALRDERLRAAVRAALEASVEGPLPPPR